jgi:hypothetical protein
VARLESFSARTIMEVEGLVAEDLVEDIWKFSWD